MPPLKKVKSSKRATKPPSMVKVPRLELRYYMQCAEVAECLNMMIGLTVRGPVLTLDPGRLVRLLALQRLIEPPSKKKVWNG